MIDTFFHTYHFAVTALGALAVLMLIQLLAADILGIVKKHIPGSPVAPDHGNLLFRVSRTVANTNESIAIFICAFLYATLSYAHPLYIGYLAWLFVIIRALYAACYFLDLRTLRSISFGLSLLVPVLLLIVGVVTGQVS